MNRGGSALLDDRFGSRADIGQWLVSAQERTFATPFGTFQKPVENRHLKSGMPMVFTHFWATDNAVKLAKALRVALEKTAIAKN